MRKREVEKGNKRVQMKPCFRDGYAGTRRVAAKRAAF